MKPERIQRRQEPALSRAETLLSFEHRRKGIKLLQTRKALEFRRKNPKFLREFAEARKQATEAMKPMKPVIVGATKLTLLPGSNLSATRYYLVEAGNERLFVKEEAASTYKNFFQSRHLALAQMNIMHGAEPILKKHGIIALKPDFAIEWQGRSFLVSEFKDLLRLDEIKDGKLRRRISEKIGEAQKELLMNGIGDFHSHNCFYDPETKRLIAFDLNRAILV